MKQRRIIFPFDTKEEIKESKKLIESVIVTDCIDTTDLDDEIPEITVFCNKQEWAEIAFRLNLDKVYM